MTKSMEVVSESTTKSPLLTHTQVHNNTSRNTFESTTISPLQTHKHASISPLLTRATRSMHAHASVSHVSDVSVSALTLIANARKCQQVRLQPLVMPGVPHQHARTHTHTNTHKHTHTGRIRTRGRATGRACAFRRIGC